MERGQCEDGKHVRFLPCHYITNRRKHKQEPDQSGSCKGCDLLLGFYFGRLREDDLQHDFLAVAVDLHGDDIAGSLLGLDGVEVVGAGDGLTGELICDGIHIHPAVVRHVFNTMPERVCVISDAMRLSGMGDGEGMLGVNLVNVKDGKATLADGTIAGSVSNMHDELKNLVSWGIPLEKAIRAMTLNPAKQIGMADEIGSLEVGKRADMVVLDENLEIAAVYH